MRTLVAVTIVLIANVLGNEGLIKQIPDVFAILLAIPTVLCFFQDIKEIVKN